MLCKKIIDLLSDNVISATLKEEILTGIKFGGFGCLVDFFFQFRLEILPSAKLSFRQNFFLLGNKVKSKQVQKNMCLSKIQCKPTFVTDTGIVSS